MKRFSTFRSGLRDKSRNCELDFLRHVPKPPQVLSQPIIVGSNSPSLVLNDNKVQISSKIKQLAAAVGERRRSDIKKIFFSHPRLAENPQALRLVSKAFCDDFDFISARAVLYSSLERVGDTGIQRYIAHLTYSARNSELIVDALERTCTAHRVSNTAPSPALVATALYGLRFLDDKKAFERVWTQISEFWNPSLKPETLVARALDLMLNEQWEQAMKLWLIAMGLNSFNLETVVPRRAFFLACRYFLVESPNNEALDRVLKMMDALGFKMSPRLTRLVLRYLSQAYYIERPAYWLEYAISRGWPLDSGCVEVVLHALIKRFPKKIDQNDQSLMPMRQRANNQLQKLGLLRLERHSLGEGEVYSELLHQLSAPGYSLSGEVVLEMLQAAAKSGTRLPLTHLSEAFKYILELPSNRLTSTLKDESNSDAVRQRLLDSLLTQFRLHGHGFHCASTDLAVVESQCREISRSLGATDEKKRLCRQLLVDFMAQYPVVSLDLAKRTRVARLLLDSVHDPEMALAVADSLRTEQAALEPEVLHSPANHDLVSLSVVLRCLGELREPITPFLRSLATEKCGIYFDSLFLKQSRRLLRARNEDLDVLDVLKEANQHLKLHWESLIDETVDVYKNAER